MSTFLFLAPAHTVVYNPSTKKYDLYYIDSNYKETFISDFYTDSSAERYAVELAKKVKCFDNTEAPFLPLCLLPQTSLYNTTTFSAINIANVILEYNMGNPDITFEDLSIYTTATLQENIWKEYRALLGYIDVENNTSTAILTPDNSYDYSKIFSKDISEDIFKTGIVVNLHIQRWRATTTLSPQDLGLPNNDKVQKELMSLGNKILLPKATLAELDSIENAGRANLIKHSIQVPWGYFIPDHLFESWNTKDTEIKEKYLQTGQNLVQSLDILYKEVLASYKSYAPVAYNTFSKDNSDMSLEWESNYINAIKSKFPSPESVSNSFKYSCTFLQIPSSLINPTLQKIVTTNDGLTPFNFYNKLLNSIINEVKTELSEIVFSLGSAKLTKDGKIHGKTLIRVRNTEKLFLSKVYPNDSSKKVILIKKSLNFIVNTSSINSITEYSDCIKTCLESL